MNTANPEVLKQIKKRRTFAIISHPDAGKTTVTEKLLLFGNAIQMAGVVKAKKAKAYATSDWMEIEKQRGISVASSVMQFTFNDTHFNLLDTPGHQDFSEDTYRVLTAVDSALMVLDAAKGIETQTKKLFQVCRDRNIPIFTLINKWDRPAKDAFELIDEIEKTLDLPCTIVTWPIGEGDQFKGVFDVLNKQVRLFEAGKKTLDFSAEVYNDLDNPKLLEKIPEEIVQKLKDDLELLEAGHPYDKDEFLKGRLSPVFFGSAINNFGIHELLQNLIDSAPTPAQRPAKTRVVDPKEKNFSGVVFKIQANMDPKHRDRCAFVRICSGVFEPGMNTHHVRLGRQYKIHNAMQFMSQERQNIEKAYAGDIIGVNDRGNLKIGDTLTEGENIEFTGIPIFSPDLFSLVELKTPLKMKQLQKGLEQLAEEGSSQLFRRKYNSDSIIGVVGRLQFEVVKFRLLNEYGADAVFTNLPYTCSRWYRCADKTILNDFESYFSSQVVVDVQDYPMMLFKDDWELNYIKGKYPEIKFFASLLAYEKDIEADA